MFNSFFLLNSYRILSYIWLLFFLIQPITSRAQSLQFEHISIDQGLSNSSVLSIVQDKDGYMWFGTRHGVNRYNAHTITSFFSNPDDASSITSSYVRSMYCDSKGFVWMGSTGGLSRYHPTTQQFNRFFAKDTGTNAITHDVVNKVVEDRKSNIWAATNRGLNLFANGQTDKVVHFLSDQIIYTVHPDEKKGVWLGTSDGLMRIDEVNGKYVVSRIESISKQIKEKPQNYIAALLQDGDHLYIGTSSSGIIVYNLATKAHESISTSSKGRYALSHNNVRDLLKTRDERIWIATQKGINVINQKKGSIEVYQYRADDPHSLSQNSVYTLYEDRQGLVWVGSYFGGVNVTDPHSSPFKIVRHHGTHNSISSNIISGIAQDSKGNLWVGTEAEGVNILHPSTGKFRILREHPSESHTLKSNLIKAIYIDSCDGIWIATYMGGLNYLNTKTNRLENYLYNASNPHTIASNNVNCLAEDSQGRFWIGTNIGLQLFDRLTGQFHYPAAGHETNERLRNLIIQYIYEDRDQDIWIGTIAGLYILRKGQSVFENVKLPNNELSHTHKINCVYQDSLGWIWVGIFQGGLYRINPKNLKDIVQYDHRDGIPGADVIGILEESNGILWLSTNNGLCRFDTQNVHFMTYNRSDGLPSNAFNNMAFFKGKDGQFYFGGYQGLISFFPEDIPINSYSPTPIIEALHLFDNKTSRDSSISIRKSDMETPQIKLSHLENVFSITFASLNYYKSSKNTYVYKLEGIDSEWREADVPEATYTNLSDGHYVFMVKARNNDGFWSDDIAQLHIRITPPFWKTWYAYVFYLLLGITFLYSLIQFFVMRKVLQKEKEIQQAKLDFFTHISHEIRTPLTLITAPLERIFGTQEKMVPLNKLHTIRDNANRLKELVNELLDFRKIENDNILFNMVNGELNQMIRHTLLHFQEETENRHINLDFHSDPENIQFVFDSFQLEKVFFNLISNACKYVDDGGTISVCVRETQQEIVIEVKDNGIGFSPELRAQLFEAFYRADKTQQQGSGLGLAISKAIVERHGGTIHIDGRERTQTQNGFAEVQIRFRKKRHFEKGRIEQDLPSPAETPNTTPLVELAPTTQKSKLLVVEDNQEMNAFICDMLKEKYEVSAAYDGASALSMCYEDTPDLILSDVAMPGMDGFSLCYTVKNDEHLDHIPVILLTAKTETTHQLEGLTKGADLYITKPFRIDFLLVSIHNLLRSREVMRKKFSQFVQTGLSDKIEDSPEKAFLDKIVRIIEADIANPQINVPYVISEMGMHHQVLYKKLRAITGLSVNELIKSLRLKKAAELLETTSLHVSEVAYAVGFNDPKYFSKEFKKQFNKLPSEYRKQV